jgi:hypothetical protein
MLAVMYVLDGEVMFNELPPYFEKEKKNIIKTQNQKIKIQNAPVLCHDLQQTHLLYLQESSLRSESRLVYGKVMKDMLCLL